MMKIEDIVFWAFIVAIVGIALWILSWSPNGTDALITLTLYVGALGILIWNKMFAIDNRANVGFIKVKNDIDKFRIEVNDRFDIIENKLEGIFKNIK
jgi:hypothetical protein